MKNNTKKLLCLVVLIIVLMIICCLRKNEKFFVSGLASNSNGEVGANQAERDKKFCNAINFKYFKDECINLTAERRRLMNERKTIFDNPKYNTNKSLQARRRNLDARIQYLTEEIGHLSLGVGNSKPGNVSGAEVRTVHYLPPPVSEMPMGQFAVNVCGERKNQEACEVGGEHGECVWEGGKCVNNWEMPVYDPV